eukprot:11816650-Ditylum_brightwellii.AAC.1
MATHPSTLKNVPTPTKQGKKDFDSTGMHLASRDTSHLPPPTVCPIRPIVEEVTAEDEREGYQDVQSPMQAKKKKDVTHSTVEPPDTEKEPQKDRAMEDITDMQKPED